jgi:predicted HicB family RNase H-like nuclease
MPPSIPAQDTRDKFIGVRGAPEDLARVTAHAAVLGYSGPVWARNALLDALEAATGYRDTARRAVTRRPNRKPRKDRQGDPPWLMLRVSAEEHRHITDLTAGQGTTITEWAWSVLGEALEKEGQQS